MHISQKPRGPGYLVRTKVPTVGTNVKQLAQQPSPTAPHSRSLSESAALLSLFVIVRRAAPPLNSLEKLEPRADPDVKLGCAARRVGSQLRRGERARAHRRALAE